METNTNQTNPVNPINKKIMVIALGALIFVMLLLFVVVAMRSSQRGTSTGNAGGTGSQSTSGGGLFGFGSKTIPSGQSTKKLASDNEVAAQDFMWIDSIKDNTNRYTFGEVCKSSNDCKKPASNNDGPAVIWARFKYYEKFKRSTDLDKIKQDLANYSNPSIVTTIQNPHWNCKLMYDLWNSSVFNTDEKTQIKKICFGSTSITLGEDEYNLTPDQAWTRIQNDVQSVLNLGSVSVTPPEITNVDAAFVMYLTAASDFAIMYVWDGKPEFLQAANGNFIKSLEVYKNASFLSPEEAGLLGVAALDIQRAMKKNELTTFAEKLSTNYTVTNCNFISDCISQIYLNNQLNAMTHNNNYLQSIKKIVGMLVENNFDYPGYAGYIYGKKAFYQKGDGVMYTTRNNSLLIPILINQ